MKHLKSYIQHINEGLIKTVDIKSFINHLNHMNETKGFKDMIEYAKAEKDGHVLLVVSKNAKMMEFVKSLISLLNIDGYFISSIRYKGTGVDEDTSHSPRSNDEFVTIMDNANKTKEVEAIVISMEPKFEEAITEKYTTLYHITEQKHVAKILKTGLVPRAKSKISYHPERIYLANKYALTHIFEKYSQYVKEPVILSINVKGMKLYPDINAGDGAVFTTENIAPDRISVLKEKASSFVNKYNREHKAELENGMIQQQLSRALSNMLAHAQLTH